jgi:hypothetical protein
MNHPVSARLHGGDCGANGFPACWHDCLRLHDSCSRCRCRLSVSSSSDGPHPEPVWRLEHVACRPQITQPIVDRRAWCAAAVCHHPLGLTLGTALGVIRIDQTEAGFPSGQASHVRASSCCRLSLSYYLVWKHIVGFLNDVVGIE